MRKNSIGNDIVALTNTGIERACNPRFYSKFLTDKEAALFNTNDLAISFVQFVWLCWSIKESVYKFQKRLQPQLLKGGWKIQVHSINPPAISSFIPQHKLLESELMPVECCYASVAVINTEKYYSWSIITPEFIYTITAAENEHENICWGIKKIGDANRLNQSSEVRKFLLARFRSNNAEILKTPAGVPYIKGHPHALLSFTHDGFFIAYALLQNNEALQKNNAAYYCKENNEAGFNNYSCFNCVI
jgi:phosphopantetheinyl transferase (holo-ACP synthase)